MVDHLFDELDRWEVDLLDDLSRDGIRDSFREWAKQAVSPAQAEAAREFVAAKIELARSLGYTLTTSRVRRGRQTVQATVLRDRQGRFVRTGGARINQFLNEAGF